MRTRKTMILLLALLVFCSALVAGCTSGGTEEPTTTPGGTEEPTTTPSETTLPTTPTLPPEFTIPETTAPDQTAKLRAQLEAQGYESLDRLLVRSDVQVAVEGENIVLSENGLELELSTQSTQVLRNGYIVAALKKQPQIVAGEVYVHQDSFDRLFLGDHPAVSLFRGISFFPEEIRTALTDPDGSDFNRKLLDEVLLPTSMGIQTPHVDVTRVFWDHQISNYHLAEDNLKKLGYDNPEQYTYSEYVVLHAQATLTQLKTRIKDWNATPFAGKTKSQVTWAEYSAWEQTQKFQEYVESLTEEELAFAREKGIEIRDLEYLSRVFLGEHMKQSDSLLKETLELHYSVTNFSGIGTQLSAEQIQQVNEAFDHINSYGKVWIPGISNFFNTYFSKPEYIQLDRFMEYFYAYEVINEYERYHQIRNAEENGELDGIRFNAFSGKYERWVVDEVLQRYASISLDDVKTWDSINLDPNAYDEVLYQEKYDAFYLFSSDDGPGTFMCVDGYICNQGSEETVILYSSRDSIFYSHHIYEMEGTVLILAKQDDRYIIKAHLPII